MTVFRVGFVVPPSRQIARRILGGICAVGIVSLPESGVARGQPPVSPEDAALMMQVQERVMALPEDSREEQGVKILLENVDAFENEVTKRRVHLSIAEIFAKRGETDQALLHFEKAGVSKPQVIDPSGIDALSRGRFLDTLVERGRSGDAAERALAFRERADVSDSEYAELTYVAGRELILSGKADEGVSLGIEAATRRPCKLAYEYLETLASEASTHGREAASLNAYRWLATKSGPFGTTERFLSNLAHAEESSGHLMRAISVLERLAKEHPKSDGLGEQLLRLSLLYSKAGDEAKSIAIRARVSEGSYPDDVKAMANRSLEPDLGSERRSAEDPSSGKESTRRILWMALNAVLWVVTLLFVFARWRSSTTRVFENQSDRSPRKE